MANTIINKILSDKLLLLGSCLGISIILTLVVPTILTPKRLSTFPPDILAESGFEKVKDWHDPRVEAEIDKRERENTRNAGRGKTSDGLMRFFVLTDLALAGVLGYFVYRRFTRMPLDAHYENAPPPLPFATPWSDEERFETDKSETIRRLVAAGLGVLITLCLVISIFQPEAFGAALFLALPIVFLLIFGSLNRSFLYARWIPADGEGGWLQLAHGGSFSREDGTSATFKLLKNFRFIDVWRQGQTVDCFKIVSRTHTKLELQHRDGKIVRYKRSMTAGEALMLNPLALLEESDEDKVRSRLRLLREKWEPVNGDGPAVQFTDDEGKGDAGAYIRFDGFAARYSMIAKAPFDTITILVGVDTITLKIISLERDELVLGGDGGSVHYKRGVSISAAEAKRRSDAFNEKMKAVGKGALLTVGAIGAGIAVLGVAAAAAASTTCRWCGYTTSGLHMNCPNCGQYS